VVQGSGRFWAFWCLDRALSSSEYGALYASPNHLGARWILGFFALLAVVCGLFWAWTFWFFLLLFLCTVAFFRDPKRTVPADPNLIVAAADGTVMDITESDENQVLKMKTRRVGIFLSIFDVHTNRAPINGRVIYREHRKDSISTRAVRSVPRRTNR